MKPFVLKVMISAVDEKAIEAMRHEVEQHVRSQRVRGVKSSKAECVVASSWTSSLAQPAVNVAKPIILGNKQIVRYKR